MKGYDSYYDPPDEEEDWDTEPALADFDSVDEFEAYLAEWRTDRQKKFAEWEQQALAEKAMEDKAVADWLAAGCKCRTCCNFMHWTEFLYSTNQCYHCEAFELEQAYELIWEGDPDEWMVDYT